MKPRKILIVTGSRGEYGYIRPILKLIDQDEMLDYTLVVTNMHLLPNFGNTIDEIKRDNFRIDYMPVMTLAGFSQTSMMKSLCVFGFSIVDILEKERPDFLLLAGDRGEQFIAAMSAGHMNIPVAHIQAGEISGNIDGLTRHALARFAHIHFAANEDAKNRLISYGEEPFRVFNVGAPQLDEFIQSSYTEKNELIKKYRIDIHRPLVLIMQHPVTEEFTLAETQMAETLKAISELELQSILIFPNSDAGSSGVQEAIQQYKRPFIHVCRSLSRQDFAGLMAFADVIVGNSSAGLLEAPSFELPAVNIGRRQQGRVQGKNVLNCGHDVKEIIKTLQKALSPEFRRTLINMENPYGDGKSSLRIIETLKTIAINDKLIIKQLTY